ncbi:NMDA receptor-regulated protein 1a [Pterulicium gracile]|uniref:NMDA receptor-regulated protein 1a n=1 Tax=Pterulicium gracile TaxID=1884261 RepID=A0A5C3QUT7_9AGAR|nr:NMDA receptor-regulated protein 1a [Pterula gracilis]
MPPTPANKRALAPKEAALFKELLTFYESRQLKNGVKTAEKILKKHPEHGETTCMKGLLLTHLGKREEGVELVKKGLRLDLTSHICWHVFGLIQKGEKDYEGTLKSYGQALKFDKENQNILRDAAHLQTQLRHFDSLVESRYILLRIRPNARSNWIALSVAYYLAENPKEALKVLEHYESILKNIPMFDLEYSETMLYHVRLLEELGEFSQALSTLDVNSKSRAILDRTTVMETRARLLSASSAPNAKDAWRAVIDHNPNCVDYYRGYLRSQGIDLENLTDESRAQALATLKDFSEMHPKASTPTRLALTLATGDDFRSLAQPYILSGLTRGIPSLYADIKPLYVDKQKQSAVESIVADALASFSPSQASSQASTSSDSGPDPTHYLWTLYFLAQHHSHQDPQKALDIIEKAIEHTPSLPELYTLKAKTLKRAGDLVGGVAAIETARDLDGQDRFLNTKSWKYWLRACGLGVYQDGVDRAGEIAGLFTKKDAPSPASDLEDMQSSLFLLEEAAAHRRCGKLGPALKKYNAIAKVFNDIEDDQFDFHGYSIRKFTVNIYLNTIKWEDQLRSHPAYVTAAIEASRIFVELHDDPSLASAAETTAQLTDAEKKAKKKAQKAAQKAKVQDDKKGSTQSSANEDKGLEPQTPKDDDPDGMKIATCSDPLERAAKFLAPLVPLVVAGHVSSRHAIDVLAAVYDVAVRRGKLLQAAKALTQAKKLDPDHPELHLRIVDFLHRTSSKPEAEADADADEVLTSFVSQIRTQDQSLDTLNSQYLQRFSTSAPAALAVATAQRILGSELQVVEGTIFSTVENPDIKRDWKANLRAFKLLTTLKSGRADEFRTRCDEQFPLSTVFKLKAETESILKNALQPTEEDEKPEVKE